MEANLYLCFLLHSLSDYTKPRLLCSFGMSLPLSARVQCAECLRILRLGARQASTSTFQPRRSGERSEGSAAPWQQSRSQNGADGQRRRPPTSDNTRITRPSDQQRPRNAGPALPGGSPAKAFSKPEASKTKYKEKDSERSKADEGVNVNFSQGSALAAFLSKSPAPIRKPQAATSRAQPRQPRPNVPRTATASQKQAAQGANRGRPPLRRDTRRPTRKVEISSMTSVNNLSRILGLKLRESG